MDRRQSGTLAARLLDGRTRQKLSLSAVARRAQISKAYLSQLERGESTQPSYEVLVRIATALGTSADSLVGQTATVPRAPTGVPASLRTFAAQSSLPPADVSMLAGIHYRGKQPRNAEDWAHIYETIKRTIR